ncbi:VIT1/CCC1 transporter family protein [Undibacterium sp. SXout11W]|uniref:VIT1/CCC1 transporter family protein n=1 Tax=Undibacterium sp. SXout11W TaxID=3413050 RepID=UPI003BF41F2E
MTFQPPEQHRIKSISWLRAAVLGANDGIVSTASLIVGVASANVSHDNILLTGVAGLVSGAMSMATGEYVSVSSQADTEQATLAEESVELKTDSKGEHQELTAIYMHRGLDYTLAKQVADKLMVHDALGAHAKDELGISDLSIARPLQAALASACSFSVGAVLPLVVTALVPETWLIEGVVSVALVSLAILGGLAAKAGAAKIFPGVLRVTLWSALAMFVTAIVGTLFGGI